LRIVDFDKGSLFVNGVDVRNYNPEEYHRHLSAVFQGFSKFNSTVKENVGLGNVDKLRYKPAIEAAIHLAEADTLVESLPNGLKTLLEAPGFESVSYPGAPGYGFGDMMGPQRHGLSGGEVCITLHSLPISFSPFVQPSFPFPPLDHHHQSLFC
jgi:ABC-type multidrug transport system fused ATPase/permease subunit